jgi:hypothetical protein
MWDDARTASHGIDADAMLRSPDGVERYWEDCMRFGSTGVCAAAAIASMITLSAAEARVVRIVFDNKSSPAFDGAAFGAAGQYEIMTGHAFGELDPSDPHNKIIQDIALAPRNVRGMVEYAATFQLVKPVDMSKSSHLMWHDVPNRGGRVTIAVKERAFGDIGLSSGWQGDNSGTTVPRSNNETVAVPVAHNPDGSAVTGPLLARIFNASGPNSQPLIVYSNPVPYRPATLDTRQATLTTHASESPDGKIGKVTTISPKDWAWAKCSADNPFPGTPDPTQICLKDGFDPALLYQIVFTAKDPYVLGIGFAAFRDVESFFKFAQKDDEGTQNPVAGAVSWSISRGFSQSGNFLRQYLHLGFNQDEAGRQVDDGMWPIIAGRRVAMNARFAQPDGGSMLYQAGSEGPQWWTTWPDALRGLPALSMLDRCTASHTCPKIIEHFGSAEVWNLRLTPTWVGTGANADIPLPANLRRYYVASTRHGGGSGGFNTKPLAAPACPGVGYGRGTFADNPMPEVEVLNAIRVHFRDWVMKDVPPPPSRYPTLGEGTLVDATKEGMGFPTIPGVPAGMPTGLINPLLDYDFGPGFNRIDGSGVATKLPPTINHVINMKVPRVDADGNELGGVPVVLREAPLGTYLGWNITAAGFHQRQACSFAGGMIPFAKTKAERLAAGDPRLSLEERYGSHDGYVAAVRAGAQKASAAGFLLADDAQSLIEAAQQSDVLK